MERAIGARALRLLPGALAGPFPVPVSVRGVDPDAQAARHSVAE
jgi:hypothetical protein